MSYFYQARYQVLKDLKEWIDESIRNGDQEEILMRKEASKNTEAWTGSH
jgi:hypothetical protein